MLEPVTCSIFWGKKKKSIADRYSQNSKRGCGQERCVPCVRGGDGQAKRSSHQLLTEVCLSLAAHTLICFSCSDASSNWACLTPVKCGENENHCVTTYVGVGIGEW